jgi:hypothetical protein
MSACGGDAREDGVTPTSAVETGNGESGDASSSDESGLPPIDDFPTPGTGIDPDSMTGCTKVDFLFVIDHSGSMQSEQDALISSFSGFIEAIEARLELQGTFHIMVTDVDAWVYGACEADGCDGAAQCEAQSTTGECDCSFPCAMRTLCTEYGDYVCGQTQPLECEDVLGAGVTYPRGYGASNTDCSFASGGRFIDGSEPDVAGAFACAAQVGIGSSNPEVPMQAMVEAVRVGGDAEACNGGFLRDDAILVVTVITDEDDNGPGGDDPVGDSPGTPHDWFDTLVEAKGGKAESIVTLALIGDTGMPGALCQPLDHTTGIGAENSPRIREFVALFGEQGHLASICAPSYESFFSDAVESIGQACDEFIPEG